MHGGKDFSMKGGDPLTGFIYTSDLARAFASRIVRSAEPVGLRGDRLTASLRFRGKRQFSGRTIVMPIVISVIGCF